MLLKIGQFLLFRMRLLQFLTKPYPPAVREGLVRLCSGGEGERGVLGDVCRYNYLLGQLFAEAADEVVTRAGHSMSDITAIGSHGWVMMYYDITDLDINLKCNVLY